MPAVLTFQALDAEREAAHRPAGLIGHLLEALRNWRQETLENRIGDMIARQGGRVTDDLERQISRQFGER